MKRHFKLISSILIMLILISLIGGCAPKNQNANAQPSTEAGANTETSTNSNYPEKPITWIIHAGPGGGLDTTARLLSKVAQKYTSVNIVVENVTGGGGAVGLTKVATSKPDGYTLGLIHPTILLDEYLRDDVKYGINTFDPVVQINSDPTMLVVKKGSRAGSSLEELIKLAKEGTVNMGIAGTWLPTDYNRMFLMDATGVKFNRIGYEGSGAEAAGGVAAGDLDCAIVLPNEWISYYKAGDMIGLAVAADERLAEFPDVPTFKELGYDIPNTSIRRSLVVPKGTPEDVIKTLEEIFLKALNDPELAKAYQEVGMSPLPAGREEITKTLVEESGAMKKFLDAHNVKPNDVPW